MSKQEIEKPAEAFVENPQPETRSGRAPRLSLKMTSEGTIDWEQVSEQQKEKFFDAVLNDPDVLQRVGEFCGATGEGGETVIEDPLAVKPKHVGYLLDGIAFLERSFIPKYIAKKSQNQVIITPEIAQVTFRFSDETKTELGPCGAQAINEQIMPHLPDWLKEWLLNVGPGAQFVGGLLMAIHEQTKAAVRMAVKENPQSIPVESKTPDPSQVN